jgi:hypothetical protein
VLKRDDALLRAQAILTGRDLTLLGWLYDHRLLTTDQVAKALFPSLDFAQRRLLHLTQLGVLDRFRPQRWEGGSYPHHYLLAQLGYEIVAGQRQEDLPRRDVARRVRAHLTSRANLPHRLGTNQVFVDLAGYARTHPGTRLAWPSVGPYHQSSGYLHSDEDNRMLMLRGGLPRPDGWGRWGEDGHEVAFFVEWDSGSEALDMLVGKVAGYELVARQTTWRWPVLFVLPSLRRERNLHTELHAAAVARHAVIATTARDLLATTGHSPADAVWRLHRHDGPRLRLARLPCTDAASVGFDPTTPATGPATAAHGTGAEPGAA